MNYSWGLSCSLLLFENWEIVHVAWSSLTCRANGVPAPGPNHVVLDHPAHNPKPMKQEQGQTSLIEWTKVRDDLPMLRHSLNESGLISNNYQSTVPGLYGLLVLVLAPGARSNGLSTDTGAYDS